MKKVLIYNPDADAQSWYRGARPWQEIARQCPDIHFDFVSKTSWHAFPVAWDQIGQYSLAFFQRPFHPDMVVAIRKFFDMKIPVWVDWDDLVTEVPWSNKGGMAYQSPEIQDAIRTILSMASIVTVSTDYLGQKFRDLKIRNPISSEEERRPEFAVQNSLITASIVTVPNAWDNYQLPKPEMPAKEKVCLWRGSITHEADLYEVRHQIYAVIKDNPDWTFYFLGCIPWWYHEDEVYFPDGVLPNMVYTLAPDPSLQTWFNCLKKINPAVVFVPLRDTPFNRAKSNIAWIESAWVGANVVGVDFDEWKMPGIGNFKGPDSFKTKLNLALDWVGSKIKFPSTPAQESWNYISKNLTLAKTNEVRLRLLREYMLGGKGGQAGR